MYLISAIGIKSLKNSLQLLENKLKIRYVDVTMQSLMLCSLICDQDSMS